MRLVREEMGRRRGSTLAVAFMAIASVPVARSAAAADDPGGVALTLSGLPSAPRSERSLRIAARGMGIQFRAPTTSALTALKTYWRGATDHCRIILYDDVSGQPGKALASASLVDGGVGWVSTALAGTVTAGNTYHLLFACDGFGSRLTYVTDSDRTARAMDAWDLEEVHVGQTMPRRGTATPLFALVFADGSWWGQPYRAMRGRPQVRVCGADQVSIDFTATRPLAITDVEVDGVGKVDYTLSQNGAMLLTGGVDQAASSSPKTLTAGTTYTLQLLGDHGSCFTERALVTDLPLGPSLAGTSVAALNQSDDGGRTWRSRGPVTIPVTLKGSDAPLAGCGDGNLDPGEQCDGAADAACPGHCTEGCTCAPTTCGNGRLDAGEQCDGPTDAACPGECSSACTCSAPTQPPPPARPYKSVYASGYLGAYDPATIPVWPKKMGLILGGPDGEGPMLGAAKAAAAAAGNGDARFVFYMSLTSLDRQCGCSDANFYDSFKSQHPEWLLRDASGNLVGTFVSQLGPSRQIAIDVGNPALVDAWANWAFAAMDRYGWDGVFADNVVRGTFYNWSAVPVNPRTGRNYTTAEYRQDTLAALQRMRQAFDARGKIFVGNHTGGWESFDDPLIQQQVTAMHGVEIEGCFLSPDGYYSESQWIQQTQYLDFANRRGILTMCNGVGDAHRDAGRRSYLLASYLLTKEGMSNLAEVNSVNEWWGGLDLALGAPLGRFACLDPGAGLAQSPDCPSSGKIYVREWQRGRVLVNPTAGTSVTVPLGATFLRDGNPVSSVSLPPHTGVVLVRP